VAFATRCAEQGRKTQAGRLSVTRGFARYMLGVDARTEVPPIGLLPARSAPAKPYLYTPAEIRRLLKAARDYETVYHPLRAWNLYCILGLLAVTGMRVSEVLNLRPEDIDWKQRVLTVRKTKFGKTRLVPLHPSTMKVLAAYDRRRQREMARRKRRWRREATHLFFNNHGRRYGPSHFFRIFCVLSRQIGLRSPGASHGPRLHDFRHRFAVETLVRWYRRGAHVGRCLPVLATYLGHTCVSRTYWYLSCTPALMTAAGARLEARWEETR
jgi:integrase/recombinase XerD